MNMKRLNRNAAIAAVIILLVGILMLMMGVGVIPLPRNFQEDFPTNIITLASFLWISAALLILRSIWRR